MNISGPPNDPSPRDFRTTQWSLVLAAGNEQSAVALEALEQLCRTYWYPLYAYVRRSGHGPEECEDLTQAFFARMLEKRYLGAADPAKGRFRTFLLCSLQRFLTDEWHRSRALKRGGGAAPVSFDAPAAEGRYQLEPIDTLTPAEIFDRRWAHSLLETVLSRLEAEFARGGRPHQFEQLKVYIVGDKGDVPIADTAARLGLSESALKAVVHRMRQRYCELVRKTVAETVQSPQDVDDELRHLLRILGG